MRALFQRRATELLQSVGLTINGTQPHDPHVHDARVYWRTFVLGSLGLGDAYVSGMWDCEKLDEFFYRVLRAQLEYDIGQLADMLLRMQNTFFNLQSVRRAFQVAQRHYDVGNGLYERMLGESMGYSSGYFGNGATTLAEAQYAKFDRVCKTLKLAPGMRVLEIGCGWGTFAAYAAQHYGVSVVGVTVSKEQLAFAEKKCEGLPVTFYFGDYRTLPKEYEGSFDRVVSIEMIEAVGLKNLRAYMQVAHTMLKVEGAFLLQAILGQGVPDSWISTRIFPNGVLPPLAQLESAIRGLFTMNEIERFGKDYDRTLMMWDERFRGAWGEIQKLTDDAGNTLYDERFYRMWRYYLMVCAGLFRSGTIDVGQIHLIKEN
ncbi:MAG: cyclopropane fatty acyl phospholipid synthase [Candidatus Pacebacteria bacterium]|nr:cyclopropane fatty acyl phospholipid synthase [Candidatus Paceibacterota bacterium]